MCENTFAPKSNNMYTGLQMYLFYFFMRVLVSDYNHHCGWAERNSDGCMDSMITLPLSMKTVPSNAFGS